MLEAERRIVGRSWCCRSCGGDIPLHSLSDEARCPFCGVVQPLDASLREELQGYRAELEQLERSAAREQEEAARLQQYQESAPEAGPKPAPGLPGREQQALWCPGCGAKNLIQFGQVLARCSYCEGALLPAAGTMEQGQTAARSRWRQAQLQRIRQERRKALWQQGSDYFAGGRWCLPTLAGCGLLTLCLMALNGSLRADTAGVVLTSLTAGAIMLSVPVLARYRRCRGGHWPALAPLVTQHGGAPLATFGDVRQWLDAHWDSYYHPFFLTKSAFSDYAALRLQSVPVLVNLHLQALDILDTARLHLLLAAPIPGLRDEAPDALLWTDEAREVGAQLSSLGFTAELWEAGVLVRATAQTLDRFRDQGLALGQLEQALQLGLRLAQTQGGAR